MNSDRARVSPNFSSAVSALRQLAKPPEPLERCEVCSVGLSDEHTHLIQIETRQLMCVCDECAISFGERQGSSYRRIPHRVRALPNLQLDDTAWDSLYIPVGMAFFFHNTQAKRVSAYYPSPAGPTESLLTLDAWQDITRANPMLDQLEPDVEALLVNRMKGARDYYIVGVDKCYELVGLVRLHWRGLSGGDQVWQVINEFFVKLNAQAETSRPVEPTLSL